MSDDKTKYFNLKIHHQLFENDKTLLKEADSHRKSIAHLVKSCKILNNESACFLLEDNFKKYKEVSQKGTYDQRLKLLLSKSENVVGTNFRSTLTTINAKQYIKPLPCTNVKSYCPESESIDQEEFSNCLEFFKNKKCSNRATTNSTFQNSNKIYPTALENKYSNIAASETSIKKTGENSSLATFTNCFKSARDELEIQNLQKYGATSHSGAQSTYVPQRRKLGKLGARSKFIPPIKSNSGSDDMSNEKQADNLDERLKNIDPKMVELIKSEIMDCSTSLHWNDIAGLKFAKSAIQEAVVWPMLRPDIFTGLRKPPKGILLFGPPGTGKTLIGKCVASQSKSTFFSISASSLTSKWVGDGEKMVRALFAVARVHQPSVIFIDEVDSLLSQRTDSEHESSRRIKTEFLVQLDGATTDSEERLLVIGATNRPQELDEAARRRFVKRLYIPLPEYEARYQLLQKLVSTENHQLQDEDFQKVALLSDGYSGADIKNLCSEASLGPIRSLDMKLIEHIQASDVRPLEMEDFEKALTRVKSSVAPNDLEQYNSWDRIYGSGF